MRLYYPFKDPASRFQAPEGAEPPLVNGYSFLLAAMDLRYNVPCSSVETFQCIQATVLNAFSMMMAIYELVEPREMGYVMGDAMEREAALVRSG